MIPTQKPDSVSPELLRQLRELGQVEGAVYWVDKAEEHAENLYNHRAATTAMRNNLHKSHVGCY